MSEFDILKNAHKFLREDEEEANTWEDKVAAKYYESLYREFAICDLKHYKSGNFALRWRTEDEVLSGAGETSCANTRCQFHEPPPEDAPPKTSLATLELPFAYHEHGENKQALVKIVLCDSCTKKIMWKRRKEKEDLAAAATAAASTSESAEVPVNSEREKRSTKGSSKGKGSDYEKRRDRPRSRSRSPRRSK